MSKGLEALEIVKAAMLSSGNCLLNSLWDYTDVIEKELKALAIIQKKHISKYVIDTFEQDWNLIEVKGKDITQEEYDILKEVLL